MHPLLQKLSASPRAAAIELVAGESFCAHIVIVRRRRQQLDVELQELNITDIEVLKKKIPQGIPVVAVLSGKGVLHRVVQSSSVDIATLLHKVLPNAAAADFAVQHIPAAGAQQLVSVMRRSAADELLEQLRSAGISVVACSLGAAAAAELIPLLLPNHSTAMQFGMHSITWENSQAAALESNENRASDKSIDLNGTSIKLTAVPAFAAAVQLLTGNGTAKVISTDLQLAAADFAQRRLFKLGGLTLLAVTLSILIGNYLVFSHYWEKKAALEEELQLNGNLLERVREMSKQTEMRRNFLSQTGLKQAGKHSFFADRLAAGLPDALLLTRLAIAPRERLQREDTIAFRPAVILLEGECAQSVLLNNWITKLNTENWIAKASLRNYVQPGNRKTGQFEIEIQLSE
jgi:hypothetical protein